MKSRASLIHRVALSILTDFRAAYPDYWGFSRDCERLSLGFKEHGTAFFTLFLPALDDLLTQGIETGRLSLEGRFTKKRSKRSQLPQFLWELWSRVFDHSGVLRPDPDPTAIAFLRQIFCLGKKLTLPCSPDRLEKARLEYHEIENKLPRPTLSWSADSLDHGDHQLSFLDVGCLQHNSGSAQTDLFEDDRRVPEELPHILRRLDILCRDAGSKFGMFEPVAVEQRWRFLNKPKLGAKHGPGAVADLVKRTTSKYFFPTWPAKLEALFPEDFFGSYSFEVSPSRNHSESPCKLISVPKTAKGPRLIASEPTSHQWCQQLVKDFLVTESERIFGRDYVSFDDQSSSQRMVLLASQNRKLATIDLSSASDRLSCWVVERVFASNRSLLDALHATRSRVVVDTIGKDKEYLLLRKFAAMGSANTFPVQTICFLLMCLAVLPGHGTLTETLERYRGQVKVFGDDIIIPSYGYARLRILLEALGLKVNERKSFVHGSFRESCGLDSFNGYDVTPVKPKILDVDGPLSIVSLNETANNLHMKGYWHAAAEIKRSLDKHLTMPIWRVGDGRIGAYSFSGQDLSHLRVRWNEHLQRKEVRLPRLKIRGTRKLFNAPVDVFEYLHRKSLAGAYSHLDFLNPKEILVGTLSALSQTLGFGWEPLGHNDVHCD